MNIELFSQLDFLPALKGFFSDLKVPINYVADEPTTAKEILKDTYKENDTFQLIEDVFFVGMVDDSAFEGNKSLEKEKIKSDYDGILIFGVTLIPRLNGLLPTRSQLADIARSFNREFYYTPVVVVFKYGNLLALANTERLKYKQEWREGEKAGKVSLLRDINIEKPHRGHNDILQSLRIPVTGKSQVDSFTKLYSHWQEVFSVSVLNKKFYQELSTWYFWATKHVSFPGGPTVVDAHHKNATLEDLQQEHKATNVIRMLTRLLFVWFIKEKKLIPEELFDLDTLQKDILNEISPYHETGIFKERNKESVYYKAILQNLFFATLNCPIDGDSLDKRKRGFRGEESKGKHFAIDWMMRYKKYFKKPDTFIDLVNSKTPFLNGGLFECLDDKPNKILIDGFSDNQSVQQQLIVPDYLFFGLEEEADISDVIGITDKKYKNAAVKGLLNILKSYKFTITENTPIEEDVALDPELLGKVFENLLASYNPETKTTARKQTGSFYTPREIVNYMVDESLIAYLKNKILGEHSTYSEFGRTQTNLFGNGGETGQQKLQIDLTGSELKDDEEQLDNLLHELVSFNPGNPFITQPNTTRLILDHLSTCTILDPACGSGAFPMGILQKMVHILQKLDPDNILWRKVQEAKAKKEAEEAFDIDDKETRNERLSEISDAFDQSINDPDYARKLFLIENCIYGVDIQPIATQISKLRFFISLVVEQKVNRDKINFGIRPLPNLETKFVAANTLIGIEKPSAQLSLYDTREVKILETELKKVRSKLFGAKSKDTKLKYRQQDEELRNAIAAELEKSGWRSDTAQKLAGWDPYDQNASSPFFDAEWMFDIKRGFDIITGNPPYKIIGADEANEQIFYRNNYKMASFKINLYVIFLENALKNLNKKHGRLSFIIPKSLVFNTYLIETRNILLNNYTISKIVEINERVFENAEVGDNIIFFAGNTQSNKKNILNYEIVKQIFPYELIERFNTEQQQLVEFHDANFYPKLNSNVDSEIKLKTIAELSNGLNPGNVKHILLSDTKESDKYQKMVLGKDIKNYNIKWSGTWVNYDRNLKNILTVDDIRSKNGMVAQMKVDFALRKSSIYAKNKILIRKTSDHIIAAYDPNGYYFDSLAYGIQLKESTKFSVFYVLSFLNSKYVNHIHSKLSLNKGKVFAKVLLKNLAEISIYNIDFNNSRENSIHSIISNIGFYLTTTSEINVHQIFQNIIDSLIFELYYQEHMNEKDLDIYKFLQDDFTHTDNNLDIAQIKDKMENLFVKYSHPDNEILNRYKLFAVRSPEILKPILES